jgi:PAS domain S-box-containing protein
LDSEHQITEPSLNTARPSQSAVARTRGRRFSLNTPIILLVIAGAITSLLAFAVTRRANDQAIQRQLETIAEAKTRQIQFMRIQGLDALASFGSFMASQTEVDEDAFDRFTALLNPNQKIYGTLLWAPRIGGGDRDRFVSSMRQVDPDFDLLERSPEGDLSTDSARGEYLPVLYEEKLEQRKIQEVRGLDIYGSAIYDAAAERARDNGLPIVPPASFSINLAGRATVPSFYIFWPVYHVAVAGAGIPDTVAGRRAAFRGMAIARYRFDEYYSALLRSDERPVFDIDSISDLTVDGGGVVKNLHYDAAQDKFTILPSDFPPVPAGAITVRQDLVNAGRINSFFFHFPAQYVAGLRSSDPYWISGLCLMLTVLVAFYMRREQTQLSLVEAMVAERTAELTTANTALAREAEERRGAEVSAERAAVFLRTVLNASPFAIIARDSEGKVTLWNRTAERLLGYGETEIIGRDVLLVPPGIANTSTRLLSRTMAGEVIQGQRSERMRKDCSIVPVRVSTAPIYAEGNVVGGCAILEDMTEQIRIEEQHSLAQRLANEALAAEVEERRRAEAAARHSSAFFRTVLDAAPFGIAARSLEGRVTLWSRGAEHIFGYTEGEIMGSDVVLTPHDTADTLHHNIERVIRGEVIHGLRTQRIRKDGSAVQLRVSFAPIYEDGRAVGTCAIWEDMTERLQIEEQLSHAQKMEAIGNLTGGMAHDFNNLLGGVIGNLDLLKRQIKSDDPKSELVDDALSAALSAAELTRRLLAFARRQPLAPKRVALNDLVRNIERLLSRLLGERIHIALDLADGLWAVIVDPAQLESSIVNLANNARDAMPKGGTLTIATANRHLDADYAAQHVEVSPGDYAMVSVSDTGTGMPPDVVARIFEPFFTTKEIGKGTGLGLSMVFGFIKQSSGHIAVYSEPGLGTTFRLYLPRAPDGDTNAETSAPMEVSRGVGEKILVVEDNATMRRTAVRQLTEMGYDVVDTGDAASALLILAEKTFDLVLTDIVMPGEMNGIALAERVAADWPTTKIVLVSGFPGSTLNAMNLASRSMRLLNKPYRRDELAQAVQEALHG